MSVLYGVSVERGRDDYSVMQYLNASQMIGRQLAQCHGREGHPELPGARLRQDRRPDDDGHYTVFTRVIPIMSRAGVNT